MNLQLVPPQEWGFFDEPRPWVVAGPCSAESRQQMTDTAYALKAVGVTVFRAGIWKPRTRPGNFEGVGKEGLAWLQEVRNATAMKVGTEVASASHVAECLDAGMDFVWLGARTTANPFLVQEIAEALRGSEVAVFVKNPVNPDAELWVGTFERLASCGVKKLAAVHRGVSSYCAGKYRNDPAWNIAIELRLRIPEIPLFCDPSHMGGSREYVAELSRRAMDLGFDGLMVESHCNPSVAMSDALQQMEPSELGCLLSGPCRISARMSDADDKSYRMRLEQFRATIDVLDEDILNLMAKRMELSAAIGELKKENNVAVLQTARWTEVLDRMMEEGASKGLSADCVRAVFSAIHNESVAVQNTILSE